MKSLVQFILEAQTKPTVEWMEEHYEKYNKELFDNELPEKITLGIIDKKTDALGWQGFAKTFYMWKSKMRNGMYISYVPKPDKAERIEQARWKRRIINYVETVFDEVTSCEELMPFIELNPKYKFSDYQKEDTMIHEMIHLWVSRNALQPKQAHGKEFRRKCDEIRAKAEKLYGVKYKLTTYATHEEDEDKDFKVDREAQTEITKEIVRASKKGGGVVSVYMVFDREKMPMDTISDIKMRQYTKRFFFCTKAVLSKMTNDIAKAKGLKDVYISTSSYIPFVEKYGKIRTINKFGAFWDATEYDEKLFMEGADNHQTFNESLVVNEGLLDKLKNIAKRIMSAFLVIDKKTPTSEINIEDMMNYAEEHQDGEEQSGSSKNDNKMIEIEK